MVSNDGSSHHSSQKRPTLTHGATPSGHQTHQTTHTQPKQGGRDRPGRPPPVSGGMGFAPAPEAPEPAPLPTGGAMRPCRGRAPWSSFGSPSRRREEGPARASLAATCSRSAPAPASWSMPRWLCSQPRATSQLQRRATAARSTRALGGHEAAAQRRSHPVEIAGRAVPVVDHRVSSYWRPQKCYR